MTDRHPYVAPASFNPPSTVGLSRTMEFKNILIHMFIIILAAERGQPVSSKETMGCLVLRVGCTLKKCNMLCEDADGGKCKSAWCVVVAKGGGDGGGERSEAV
ncbi:hypothetical protein Tco_0275986 [Tanacetum coccineum]